MSEQPSAPNGAGGTFGGMPPLVQNILIISAIVLAGAIIGWIARGALTGAPAKAATVTVYEDWQVVCPGNKVKGRSCEVAMDVVNSKNGQRMARVSIRKETVPGKDDDKNKELKDESTLFLTVPLGVLIEPGVTLRLGAETLKPYAFKTCMEDGCTVTVPFDDNLIDQFAEAQDASLTVGAPTEEKTVDIPFSTKGFSKAYGAYKTGEARRKSWFWRLWL